MTAPVVFFVPSPLCFLSSCSALVNMKDVTQRSIFSNLRRNSCTVLHCSFVIYMIVYLFIIYLWLSINLYLCPASREYRASVVAVDAAGMMWNRTNISTKQASGPMTNQNGLTTAELRNCWGARPGYEENVATSAGSSRVRVTRPDRPRTRFKRPDRSSVSLGFTRRYGASRPRGTCRVGI